MLRPRHKRGGTIHQCYCHRCYAATPSCAAGERINGSPGASEGMGGLSGRRPPAVEGDDRAVPGRPPLAVGREGVGRTCVPAPGRETGCRVPPHPFDWEVREMLDVSTKPAPVPMPMDKWLATLAHELRDPL